MDDSKQMKFYNDSQEDCVTNMKPIIKSKCTTNFRVKINSSSGMRFAIFSLHASTIYMHRTKSREFNFDLSYRTGVFILRMECVVEPFSLIKASRPSIVPTENFMQIGSTLSASVPPLCDTDQRR